MLKSNIAIRGQGANNTRLHILSGAGCANGQSGFLCVEGGDTYAGFCNIGTYWPCPNGDYVSGWQDTANWTGGYSQGASTITLDSVTGITVNQTPIVLDQCDVGYSGSTTGTPNPYCAPVDGAITAATIYSGTGGSNYTIGDTFNILSTSNYGANFGFGATGQVTSVSGGAVTGFTVTAGGGGYTYTNTGFLASGNATSKISCMNGSCSGLEVQVTAITGYDNNAVFSCAVSMVCTNQSPANIGRVARSQGEVVVATNISGSGPYTLTLNHPLMHANWASGQGTQAWWGTPIMVNAGIEDMEIDDSAVQTSSIVIDNAYGIWVTGITSSTGNGFHIKEYNASNILVANSYFYLTAQQGTVSYGIGSFGPIGNSLFENNILQGIVDPVNAAATCSGCVFAYNFTVNQQGGSTAVLFAGFPHHTASTDYTLTEGNITGSGMNLDNIHGPHFLNTYLRNYFGGYELNGVGGNTTMPTQSTVPMIIASPSRYQNVLANVLGTPGYHTTYQCVPATNTQATCSQADIIADIYQIGWSGNSSGGAKIDYSNTPPSPNDTLTTTSLYRYGNYDSVNSSVQFNSAEVPTSDPNYPNSVPSSHAFPASFYNGVTAAHASCGTGLNFWKNPTTGLCPPYPSVGPDVTSGDIGMCTSGTYKWSLALTSGQCASGSFSASINGGYGNSNPAMRCYLNQMSGPPNGTGSLLTFSRTTCYEADTSSQASAPSCSPGTGTYTGSQSVTCTNPNSGTTVMCYATGATTPVTNGAGTGCTTGTQYTTAITVSSSETLNIVAGTSTLSDSNEVSYVYTITTQASPATCSPTSGNVPQTVTCTNPNSGTTIACYTTNGSTPATNGLGTGCTTGTQYTTALTISTAETLKIIAGTSTLSDSSVNSYIYTASSGVGAGITNGTTLTTGTELVQ